MAVEWEAQVDVLVSRAGWQLMDAAGGELADALLGRLIFAAGQGFGTVMAVQRRSSGRIGPATVDFVEGGVLMVLLQVEEGKAGTPFVVMPASSVVSVGQVLDAAVEHLGSSEARRSPPLGRTRRPGPSPNCFQTPSTVRRCLFFLLWACFSI